MFNYSELTCVSVIETLKAESPTLVRQVNVGTGDSPIEVATVSDILYLPEPRLQVWRDKLVPSEGIIYSEVLDEIKDQIGPWTEVPAHEYEINQEVCILSNFYSNNFYHSFEELLKVMILERSGFSGSYVVYDMPQFALGLMDLVGVSAERRLANVAGPTLFRTVVFPTELRMNDLLEYRNAFFALRQALIDAAASNAPATTNSRLWIDRGTQTLDPNRGLVNEAEVSASLDRYGFTRIDMGSMPVGQQIATARQAKVFAGPHGGAFAHTMFLDRRSTVIECFSPRYIHPCVIQICRMLIHDYHQLVPFHDEGYRPYQHGNKVFVDCSHLETILQRVCIST